MRFFRELSTFFLITITFNYYCASQEEQRIVPLKPQKYFVYSEFEKDNRKGTKIEVKLDTLGLFETLKNMFADVSYSGEENYNEPIGVGLDCSPQAIKKIFDKNNLLSLRDTPFALKQAVSQLSLEELVDTINCIHKIDLIDKKMMKDYFLQPLATRILDIATQFQQYIMHKKLYQLPDYKPLKFLNNDVYEYLKSYNYDIQNTLWNRLNPIIFALDGNPAQNLQNLQSKPIGEVFNTIADKLTTKSNLQEEIQEKKDTSGFNYKAFLFAAFLAAIAGGKKLWDLYKSRLESQ